MADPKQTELLEIGVAVQHAIGVLLRQPEVALAATPIDVMSVEGVRRAFIFVTINEDAAILFERAMQQMIATIEQQRKRPPESKL